MIDARTIAAVVVGIVLTLLVPLTAGAEPEYLVLEVAIDSTIASDAMPALRAEDDSLYLPLGEICELVRFPIAVVPSDGTAAGWFVDPERTFELDVSSGTVTITGEERAVPAGALREEPDDIYVASDVLSTWFPIRFELDYRQMSLLLHPAEQLAFQASLERARRRANHRVVEPLRGPAYRVHQQPYALWSPPVHDVELQGAYPTAGQAPVARRAITQRNGYDVRGAGDLLWMSGFWRVRGSETNLLEQIDMRLGRADPGGSLLGPLAATEFSMGDVTPPTVPLLTRGTRGVGFVVSSFPLDRPTTHTSKTITGALDPGWEVELYHNDRFIGFARADGVDEFGFDAPVSFGPNEYRLEYWGPYGEHRVRYSHAEVGPEMVRQGDFHYRVSSGLHQRGLIPVEDWERTLPTYSQPRATAEVEYGLVDSLSLFVDTATVPLRDGRHTYAGGGVAAYTSRAYGTLRVLGDTVGAGAGEATVQSRLLGMNLKARHVQFLGSFFSEEFPVRADPMTSRSEAGVVASIPLWGDRRLPSSATVRHDRHQAGPSQTTVQTRVSGAVSHLGWHSNLRSRAVDSSFTDLDGRTSARWRSRHLSPHLEVGYRLVPQPSPSSIGGGVTWRMTDTLGADVRLLRELHGVGSWRASGGLRHRFKYFEWQAEGGYSDLAGFSAGLTLRASIGPAPDGSGIAISSERRTTSGEVVATVFRDADGDGIWDDDEPLLSDATLRLDGLRKSGLTTDENGRATLTDASPKRFANLAIETSSLQDPFDIPATNGITVIPRPGRTSLVALPVVITGQVEGLVTDAEGSPVSAAIVELRTPDGEIAEATKSAFDGFYVFERVRPGAYEVHAVDAHGRWQTIARELVVSANGDVVAGQDLQAPADSIDLAER